VVFDRRWPAWSGAAQVAVLLLGFLWAGQFFWRRKEYRQRWAGRAYRNAFGRHVLVGMPVVFAAIVHNAYLPGEVVVTGAAVTALTVIVVYLAVTGTALWARAVLTFGFDNLGMLYVYFPEDGRLVDESVYSKIRHPVYSALIRVGLALGLWRGTWFSIAFGLFMPVGLTLWLRLVEEPELIERFGDGYAAYRRKVPAFWSRVKDAGGFLRFLFQREAP
jgi:protein-S-isoprenylcysteine O-methyltransferase Ste14